jgi:ComF family protein
MQAISKIFNAVSHLMYPQLCVGCATDLNNKLDMLCYKCLQNLPHTNFASFANNPIEKLFIGRIPLQAAHVAFYFSKGELIQHLIHEFKYNGNQALGNFLGEILGMELKGSHRFSDVDYIIPLPLFADKAYKRGFNQAAVIADGIAIALLKAVVKENVLRIIATATQTKKHRVERWENVAESFHIKNPNELKGKHILLVDDVITTGATIDACAQKILAIPNTKLSIAALAIASK